MHDIAITRPQFDETEMHEVHSNHTHTAHHRKAYRRPHKFGNSYRDGHNQSSAPAAFDGHGAIGGGEGGDVVGAWTSARRWQVQDAGRA